MSKGNAVRILNSAGKDFTSRRKALRYIAGGRARYIDEHTIEMIPEDRRHQACIASANSTSGATHAAHSPVFEIVARHGLSSTKVLVPLGFLHYPHKDQTTRRRG